MTNGRYTASELFDGARTMVALVRAFHGNPDFDGEEIRILLDGADLRIITEAFTVAFHELAVQYAKGIGQDPDTFLDERLQAILAGLRNEES